MKAFPIFWILLALGLILLCYGLYRRAKPEKDWWIMVFGAAIAVTVALIYLAQ